MHTMNLLLLRPQVLDSGKLTNNMIALGLFVATSRPREKREKEYFTSKSKNGYLILSHVKQEISIIKGRL